MEGIGQLFTPETQRLFMRARMRWGHLGQTDVAIEEMAELTKAIVKNRNRGLSPKAVSDEVADVLIMVAQLRLIFGPGRVDAEIERKLARLEEMLDGPDGVDPGPRTADN